MKKLIASSLAAAGLVTTAGCGGSPVTSGTVIGKADHPARTSIYLKPITSRECRQVSYRAKAGKYYTTQYRTQCQTIVTGHVTVPIYHPETWSLELKNSKGKTGWVNVSQQTYAAVVAGSHYPNGGDG